MAEALVYSTNSTNLWHHVWFLFENKTRQPTITTTSIFRKHYPNPKPLPCSFVNYHADTVHPQIFPHFFHGYFHGENLWKLTSSLWSRHGRHQQICRTFCAIESLCHTLRTSPSADFPMTFPDLLSQWPFQEPKLEVPTIYKAYLRAM